MLAFSFALALCIGPCITKVDDVHPRSAAASSDGGQLTAPMVASPHRNIADPAAAFFAAMQSGPLRAPTSDTMPQAWWPGISVTAAGTRAKVGATDAAGTSSCLFMSISAYYCLLVSSKA